MKKREKERERERGTSIGDACVCSYLVLHFRGFHFLATIQTKGVRLTLISAQIGMQFSILLGESLKILDTVKQ